MTKKTVLWALCFAMLAWQCKAAGNDDVTLAERQSPAFALGHDQHLYGYYPNKHMAFKSDSVCTAQLEVQESMLSRLDWLLLESKSIGRSLETSVCMLESSLYKLGNRVSKLEARMSKAEAETWLRLNIIIGILAAIMLILLCLLLCIAVGLAILARSRNEP